ncbi:MAG: RagB/SusD family nutrient uptake outer membrane protein, partial [Bacteroidales bacterium]|nr:RagB/SusD family nutrient uptake outer membrane protein [Bacteroidales bacterium]
MKKIYIAFVCLMGLATASCNDFLDVRPKGQKVENDLFDSSNGFEDAIYGVYGYMGSQPLYGMDMVWGIPELLNQNLECSSEAGTDFGNYDYNNNLETRKRILDVWTNGYQAIGYANNVLKNIESTSSDKLPLYNIYKGEMLGARAMVHFDLLRLFAPTTLDARGIPYVTSYSFSVKPFSTVGECRDFIINDLLEAEKLLADQETITYPRDNDQYEKFNRWRENHLNLYAIKALLARVYWYFGDNAKAAEYAESVINSGRFPLVDVTEIQSHVAGVLCPKETIFGLYCPKYLDYSTKYLYNFQSYLTYTSYDDDSGIVHVMPWHKLFDEVDV